MDFCDRLYTIYYFGYKGKRVVVTRATSGMGDAATKRHIIGAGVKGGE